MNLNKEDIDALEDAAKKATPGPWRVQHPNAGVRAFSSTSGQGPDPPLAGGFFI